MKKLYNLKSKLAISIMCLGATQIANAQVSTLYTFSQSNNVYTPITGGTVLGSPTQDDGTFAGTIGFTFAYDGLCYTNFFMTSNGALNLGNTGSGGYFQISAPTRPTIAAFNADNQLGILVTSALTLGSPVANVSSVSGISVGDLISSGFGFPTGTTVTAVGATNFTASANATGTSSTIRFSNGEMRFETLGSAPNRRLVAQWSKSRKFFDDGTNDNQNYQVILEETTNKISIIYGMMVKGSVSNTYEVGLSGGTAANFSNRTTATDWSATTAGVGNTANCIHSNLVFPTSGLTFEWTPTFSSTPPVLLLNVAGATNFCGTSGTNTLTVSGAATYSWSTGSTSSSITPTSAINTVYTVIGTAANCSSATQSISITVSPNPTVTIGGTSTYCSNALGSITASGASSYAWSNGSGSNTISPNISGTYTVTGTTNGCSGTASQAVVVNTAPNVTLTVSGAIFACPGGTLTNLMTASGTTSYTWSTGALTNTINPITTATTLYQVTGEALNGCRDTKSQVITVSNPNITASSSSNLICPGQPAVTLTANGGTTYTWSTGSSSNTISVLPTTTTSYTVTGTVLGCSGIAVITQSVSACTSIEDLENNKLGVSIYPNPNNGTFTINLLNGLTKTIEITDVTGRLVFVNTTANDNIEMNIDQLNGGIYYVKVISNNRSEVVKIIKQ